jgi:hypothetical protein
MCSINVFFQVGGCQSFCPEQARDVGQNTDAIAFTVHDAGTVSHAGEGFDCPFNISVSGLSAFANCTNQCAGVMFLSVDGVKLKLLTIFFLVGVLHTAKIPPAAVYRFGLVQVA